MTSSNKKKNFKRAQDLPIKVRKNFESGGPVLSNEQLSQNEPMQGDKNSQENSNSKKKNTFISF